MVWAACSGADVKCCTHWHLIEDGLHPRTFRSYEDGLHPRTFRSYQRIQLQIVGLGPPCIPLDCIDFVSC